MFSDYVFEHSPAQYANYILIDDFDGLHKRFDYISVFEAHGFEVAAYQDDLHFRVEFEDRMKSENLKLVVLRQANTYLPYDMTRLFARYTVSLRSLFPKLNPDVLSQQRDLSLDLLTRVADQNYDTLLGREQTERYFEKVVCNKANLNVYFRDRLEQLLLMIKSNQTYRAWFVAAQGKAEIDRYSVQYGLDIDTSELNMLFQEYALRSFGTLSSKNDKDSPVLVSRAMEYMCENSSKFVVIVMDGMSEFDWNILSESFDGIAYEQSAAFAMIPSTTSVSRQCLLSNKFPSQLADPWSQGKERTEFVACAKAMGFSDEQIAYERGYTVQFSSFVRCGAIIINDVDDLVHAQPQGKIGMFNDISVMASEGRLASLTRSLLSDGFDVYITADHGNTQCTGTGRYVGAGVDVETRSHRMLVLRDFANKKSIMDKFAMVEYPKYYLPKENDYLICNSGTSLDVKGEQVMTHGGMTLDEVIVPFIKIKAGDGNV